MPISHKLPVKIPTFTTPKCTVW